MQHYCSFLYICWHDIPLQFDIQPSHYVLSVPYMLHATWFYIFLHLFGWLTLILVLFSPVQVSPPILAWKGSNGNWLTGMNVFQRLPSYNAEHYGEYCWALWRILQSIFGSRHSEGFSAFSQFIVSILRFISNIIFSKDRNIHVKTV